jgi:hypothetical protein
MHAITHDWPQSQRRAHAICKASTAPPARMMMAHDPLHKILRGLARTNGGITKEKDTEYGTGFHCVRTSAAFN